MRRLPFVAILLLAPLIVPAPAAGQAREWLTHVRNLADDSLQGGDSGTEGWRQDSCFRRFAQGGTS